MRAYLQVLSTGTADCPPSVILHFDQKRYMINCGEGIQRLCTENKVRLTKLQTLMLTRTHWDCTGGLPGIVLLMCDLRMRHITVMGPQNLTHNLLASRHFLYRNTTHLETIEFGGDMADEGPMYDVDGDHPSKGTRTHFQDEHIRITSVIVHPVTTAPPPPLTNEDRRNSRIRQQQLGAMFTLRTLPPASWASKPPKPEHPQKHKHSHHQPCVSQEQQAQASQRALEGLENMIQGGHPDLPPTQPNPTAITYICQAPDYQGKFDKAAALALGVTPGPLFRELLSGNPVTSTTTGNLVYPEQVITGARPGRIFVVVDCPSVSYISNLVRSTEFTKFYCTKDSTTLNKVECIVHMAGQAVMIHPQYRAWMQRFGDETQHLVAHSDYCGQGFVFPSQALCSLKLSKLSNTIFPVPYYDNAPAHVLRTEDGNQQGLTKVQRAENGIMFMLEPTVGLDRAEVVEPTELPKDFAELERYNPVFLQDYSGRADKVLRDIAQDPETEQEFPGKDVVLTALGTGSSKPSKYRNVSATVLDIPGRGSILLDVGEGNYGQMFRHFGGKRRSAEQKDSVDDRLRQLKGIFISHLHADHHLGIVTVIDQWTKLRNETHSNDLLYLIAPEKFHVFLTEISQTQDFGYQHVRFIDSSDLIHPSLPSPPQSPSSSQSLTHLASFQSLTGFSAISTVVMIHCNNAFGICLTHADGWKLVYSGDSRPSQDLVLAGKGATVLLHEATFEDDMVDEAIKKRHSTTKEAIEVGEAMDARAVLLTHFSQRYPKIPRFEQRKDRTIEIGICFDLMSVRFGEIRTLKKFLPALEALYTSGSEEGSDDAGDVEEME
ncbi:Zinc phosphodiesterase ELAC protein 2 [Podila minutissima]|uniref:ribonuclease Z n=1 Tax=Podila minutissima TaxID=64525 RepID=A0A9P5SYG4_9FUNG|nr:Zinc phosphodiesterase ELAC protein 2 [Podila minutissima]